MTAEFQEAHLDKHDPVRRLGLTDDSVLFRCMRATRIVDSRVCGNSEPVAKIRNHLALQANPLHEYAESELKSQSPELRREDLERGLRNMPSHLPVDMTASELPTPSLNVTYPGSAAMEYSKPGYVLCAMRLGDLRQVGGGLVFSDIGAARQDNPEATALIVTIPSGKDVVVTVYGEPAS